MPFFSSDKAVAVSYPLKSSIWVTHRRAFYICCVTIVTLSLANLSFIQLSGIRTARNRYKYCGLKEGSFIVDLLTASILPMGNVYTYFAYVGLISILFFGKRI
jgi:hypothetical protein